MNKTEMIWKNISSLISFLTATTAELVYSDKMGMTGACTVTKWV
jgi:hypothetical protein